MKLTVPALRPPEPDLERLASAEGTSHLLDEIDRLLADNAAALNQRPHSAPGSGRTGRPGQPPKPGTGLTPLIPATWALVDNGALAQTSTSTAPSW